MILKVLKAKNLMGCDYNIEFDFKYTIIIGDNRQGKTLVAKLMMLALYGTGQREKDLHDSWKLRIEELLPYSDKGKVELILENDGKVYKIEREFFKNMSSRVKVSQRINGQWELRCKRDTDTKSLLEEEIGVTPGLMNVIMSNEQSMIGAVSYDKELQTSIWQGWRWKTEIIRDNIRKARDKCAREANNRRKEVEEIQEGINSILRTWIENNIFSGSEIKEGIDDEKLQIKLVSIKKAMENVKEKHKHYSTFHDKLVKLDNLENEAIIQNIITSCEEKKEFLDEKDEVTGLKIKATNYLQTLRNISEKGGEEGIQEKIRELGDEEKKLISAKKMAKRKSKPLAAKCNIYPPEDGEDLTIEIPSKVATEFRSEEIAKGRVAIPYDQAKEKRIIQDKKELEGLLKKFDEEKNKLKKAKDNLRDELGEKKENLRTEKEDLGRQQSILDTNKDRYLSDCQKIKENERLAKKLDNAKYRFDRLYNTLNPEESLRKIRKETVAFINRIYEKVYGWDINAKLENEDKVMVTDAQGNMRSHPSGSEIHIMGLAWRWIVARSFDFPLVLDELDALLDEQNFDNTCRLIEDEMDRQTVILTLKKSLKDIPGKIYRVSRQKGISQLSYFRE